MCEKILLAVCAIICLANAETPSFITKCKSDDSKCAKESAQVALPIFAKGLPDNNVEILDPVTFKEVDASKDNLIFKLDDVIVTGLQNCKVKNVERGGPNSKMHLVFLCEAELNGNYILKGQLLVLAIEGKGKIYVKLGKTQIDLTLNIEDKIGADGKKHWHIKSWEHSFQLKEKSDVRFENLFDGNEVLAQAAKELIANNGNDIIKDIGSPMIKATVARVVKNCEQFFKAYPVEDLSID